jgi:hypothetical protein
MLPATAELIPFRLRIACPADVEAEPLPNRPRQTPTPLRQGALSELHLPFAMDLYPEHGETITKLRRVGITKVFGFFDQVAWSSAIRAAELYRLPVHGRARANLAPLIDETSARVNSALLYSLGLVGRPHQTRLILAGVLRQHEVKGTLLSTLFPNFAQWTSERYAVQIAYPAIPHEIWHLIHRARLAGGVLEVAAPANAIQLVDLGEYIAAGVIRSASSRAMNPDPIITVQLGDTIAVLGRYGEAETLAMATLIEVLESMAARL